MSTHALVMRGAVAVMGAGSLALAGHGLLTGQSVGRYGRRWRRDEAPRTFWLLVISRIVTFAVAAVLLLFWKRFFGD